MGIGYNSEEVNYRFMYSGLKKLKAYIMVVLIKYGSSTLGIYKHLGLFILRVKERVLKKSSKDKWSDIEREFSKLIDLFG